MPKVVSMINWKGGVGKTTLTLHIAAGLADRHKRVLLVDLDAQCNLSFLESVCYRRGSTPGTGGESG